MPKIGRSSGPSHSGQTVEQPATRIVGGDLELLGSSSDAKVGGDLTVDGILTPHRIGSGFGGFEVEDYAWPATALYSTNTMLTTNNYPRLSFPSGSTTSAFLGAINFPDWYEAVDIHIGWTNEGAGAGTVVWAWNLVKVPVGTDVSAKEVLSSGFPPTDAPGAGDLALTVLDTEVLLGATGTYGYTLGFEIARIGGADTLANAAGLVAVGFTRLDT